MSKCVIGNVRNCCYNGHVKFPLESFLNDFQMKHSQESASETKSKSCRTLGSENKGGIIKLKFFHRRSQILIFFGINGINTGKYHGLYVFKSCHRFSSGIFS